MDCIRELSKRVKSEPDLIVFNPLSWEVKNWCECDLEFDEGVVKGVVGLKLNYENGTENEKIIDVEVLQHSLHPIEALRQ